MPKLCDDASVTLGSIPGFVNAQVVNRLAVGSTSNTYLIERSKERFVLRLRLEDASVFVPDIQLEERCSSLAYRHGLAPETVFCDISKGVLIRRYIEGVVWSSEQVHLEAKLSSLALALSRLHRISVDPVSSSWPSAAVNRYQNYLSSDAPQVLISSAQSILDEIASMPVETALCHNDLVCGNILQLPQGKVMFIDWEYSSIADPYFDLANIIQYHSLSADLEALFLNCYAKAAGIQLSASRLELWKLFYNDLQALWLLTLRQKGRLDLQQSETLEGLLAQNK